MSIISDALRKAQNKRAQEASPPTVTERLPVEKATPKKPHSRRLRFVQACVILGCIIAMVFIFGPTNEAMNYVTARFDALRHKPAATQPVVRPPAPVNPAPARAPSQTPPEEVHIVHASSKLDLSGIVFGAGEPFAVINDEIVVEGDAISGWKVVSIEQNRVTLLSGSKQETLNLK